MKLGDQVHNENRTEHQVRPREEKEVQYSDQRSCGLIEYYKVETQVNAMQIEYRRQKFKMSKKVEHYPDPGLVIGRIQLLWTGVLVLRIT